MSKYSRVFDIGCYYGTWPFFRTEKQGIEAVAEPEKCLFSSFDAIFLRDPLQGDEELHRALTGTLHGHVVTINPTMPAAEAMLEEGVKRFRACGVRLHPGYHDYLLTDACVKTTVAMAKDLGIPVFVNMRMEDERLNYVVKPRKIPMHEVQEFLEGSCDATVILSNIYIDRMQELNALRETINTMTNVYFDTCGLKDNPFIYDRILTLFSAEKVLYASQSPMFVRQSSLYALEHEVERSVRDAILWENAQKIFAK